MSIPSKYEHVLYNIYYYSWVFARLSLGHKKGLFRIAKIVQLRKSKYHSVGLTEMWNSRTKVFPNTSEWEEQELNKFKTEKLRVNMEGSIDALPRSFLPEAVNELPNGSNVHQ